VPALQAQSPEFNPPVPQKKKKRVDLNHETSICESERKKELIFS
jgi:hypothetical protein